MRPAPTPHRRRWRYHLRAAHRGAHALPRWTFSRANPQIHARRLCRLESAWDPSSARGAILKKYCLSPGRRVLRRPRTPRRRASAQARASASSTLCGNRRRAPRTSRGPEGRDQTRPLHVHAALRAAQRQQALRRARVHGVHEGALRAVRVGRVLRVAREQHCVSGEKTGAGRRGNARCGLPEWVATRTQIRDRRGLPPRPLLTSPGCQTAVCTRVVRDARVMRASQRDCTAAATRRSRGGSSLRLPSATGALLQRRRRCAGRATPRARTETSRQWTRSSADAIRRARHFLYPAFHSAGCCCPF